MNFWTAAQTYADPLGRSERGDDFDAETRRRQRQRNSDDEAREQALRTDGIVEEGPPVHLADLLGVGGRTEAPPETISPEHRNALFGLPVYEEPQDSPEAIFRRQAREEEERSRIGSVLKRLREIEREKSR